MSIHISIWRHFLNPLSVLRQKTIHGQMHYLREKAFELPQRWNIVKGPVTMGEIKKRKKRKLFHSFFFSFTQSPLLEKQCLCCGGGKLNVIMPWVRGKEASACWSWSGIQSNPDGQLTFPLIQAKWSAQAERRMKYEEVETPLQTRARAVGLCAEQWSVRIECCTDFLCSLSACNGR